MKTEQLIKEATEETILTCYARIGTEYLHGETAYTNDLQGIQELIEDWELEPNEIILYLFHNPQYSMEEEYAIFDSRTLSSVNREYLEKTILEKQNNEIIELLENDERNQFLIRLENHPQTSNLKEKMRQLLDYEKNIPLDYYDCFKTIQWTYNINELEDLMRIRG